MLDLLTVLASTEGEGSSKALFYVVGGLAAVYGVLIATLGITQPDFPRAKSQARAVFAASAAVVALAIASALITN